MSDGIEWQGIHAASGTEVPLTRLRCEETPLMLDADFAASVTIADPTGYWTNLLPPGAALRLDRLGGEFTFPGVIEDVFIDSDAEGGDVLDVKLRHEAYARLEGAPCDPYVFDEDGLDASTRDAVFISPWIMRPHVARGGALDADGSEPYLDGVTIKRAFEAALGVSHSWQLDFKDGRHFLPSQIRGDPNPSDASLLDVYQDEAAGDLRPRLQRIRTGAGTFGAGDVLESIAFMNGSPANGVMGAPTDFEVIFIGLGVTAQDPTLRVCRNALGTRDYQAVTLSKTANYLGSGLDAWTGTATLTGTEAGAIGFEITIPGTPGDAASTKIEYARLYATTATDTGITAGTLEDITAEGGLSLYVNDDFTGMNRLAMASRIQRATRSDPTVNPGPYVDAYLDGDLQAHLLNRRGVVKVAPVSSLESGDLVVVRRERVGRVVAHRVVAFGGGQGSAEIVLEDDADFDAGGLRHPENDPSGAARYGLLGKTLIYRDQNAASKPELRRRARAFAQHHEHPEDFYSAEFTPRRPRVFRVGDSIPLDEVRRGITGSIRVTERVFTWTPDGGELWGVGLGSREAMPQETFRSQRESGQQVNRNAKQTTASGTVGGSGAHGDKDEFARGTLIVPDGVEVERYLVRLRTVPWQAFSRAVDISGVTIEDEGSHTHGMAHTHTIPALTVNGVTNGASSRNVTINENGVASTDPVSMESFWDNVTISAGGSGTVSPIATLTVPTGGMDADQAHLTMTIYSRAAWTGSASNRGIIRAALVRVSGTVVIERSPYTAYKMPTNDAGETVGVPVQVAIPLNRNLVAGSYEIWADLTSVGGASFEVIADGFITYQHDHGSVNHQHDIAITSTVAVGGPASSTSTTDAGSLHAHTFTGGTADILYGVNTFKGDTPGATAILGAGIEVAFNPALNDDGSPVDFNRDKVAGLSFGDPARSSEVLWDATNYLPRLANGRPKPGAFPVFMRGAVTANNAQGIFVVEVVGEPTLKMDAGA